MDDGANCCTSDTILLTTSERSSPVVSTYVSTSLQRYEELQQLPHEILDVVQLHQRDDQLQGTTPDGGVAFAQTAENGRALPQHRVLVDGGHLQEQRERHEADIGVVVLEERAEDVGGFENVRRRHLQRHQHAHTLVENRVARHGGRLGPRDDLHEMTTRGRYTRHHVGDGCGCVSVIAGENPKESQHLNLDEGIGHRAHAAFSLLTGGNGLQTLGETRNQLSETRNVVGDKRQNTAG